jgi:hypothetical protein
MTGCNCTSKGLDLSPIEQYLIETYRADSDFRQAIEECLEVRKQGFRLFSLRCGLSQNDSSLANGDSSC